jgi:PHD/YefM family antitoxin component YafN of YafNO toxin-antitoxin module
VKFQYLPNRSRRGIIIPQIGGDTMPQIVPIRDLKNTTEISNLCHTANEPIFITQNGYGDMVIMSMDVFRRDMLMQDVYRKIEAAEDEFAQGKALDAKETMKALRAKHGI